MPTDQRQAMRVGERAAVSVRVAWGAEREAMREADAPKAPLPVIAQGRQVEVRRVEREAPVRFPSAVLVLSGRVCNPRELLCVMAVAEDFGLN